MSQWASDGTVPPLFRIVATRAVYLLSTRDFSRGAMTDTDQDGSPPARAGFVAHERPHDAASAMAICLLSATEVEAALPELVAVLHDAVERGASVGFLPPLSAEEG